MKPFNLRLQEYADRIDSRLCVGLDINPELLKSARPTLADLQEHTFKIIDATRDLAAAFKPNLAFFERWGAAGFGWLEATLERIGAGPLVIGDAKRGDIGNTARQYAVSLFDHFGFDAVTINPYMGRDALEPFLDRPEKGAFILCRTSNPSAGELQNIESAGKPLYLRVAELALELNRADNVGLVVGATAPAEIARVRKAAPQLPFLIPGIGAQGGDLAASYRAGNSGGFALINVSRGICFAGDHSAAAIRQAALDYREKMRRIAITGE
ncbi:MAG: orotidine-5'-phosphate decarboxylase [Candidatus Neomarinimicrobiota bacterium]